MRTYTNIEVKKLEASSPQDFTFTKNDKFYFTKIRTIMIA